jgi:hypothetical protein
VPLRRIVHAQIVADAADHDLTGVDTDARRQAHSGRPPQLVGVALEFDAQMQRRVAGPLGVILVRDRRTEERHDAVAGELIDEALEALDAIGEDREEALHDLRPLFRI